MAAWSLHTSASSEFVLGSRERYRAGERRNKQVKSLRHGGGAGGVGAASFLVCSESRERGICRIFKDSSNSRENLAGWWGVRSWSSRGGRSREIVRGVDGDGWSRDPDEASRDAREESFSRGHGKPDEFYVDQPFEYNKVKDSFRGNPLEKDGILVKRTVQGENFEEGRLFSEAEERRLSTRRRGELQLDGESTEYDRRTKDEGDEAWGRVSAGIKSEGTVIDRTKVGFYQENLVEDRRPEGTPFTRYELDDVNNDSRKVVQEQDLARNSWVTGAQLLGPSGRGDNNDKRQDDLRGSRDCVETSEGDFQKGRLDERSDEELWQRRNRRPLRDKRNDVEIFEEDLQRSKLDQRSNEELWQRRSQRPAGSSSRDPIIPVLTSAPEDEVYGRRGWLPTDRKELEQVDQSRTRPDRNVDDGVGFRSYRDYDVSGVPADKESDEVVLRKERRSSRVATETEVLARGALYAKQVVSQATARNLGVVTQLWVDMQRFRVVALEVRPSLLFGESDGILLRDLSKVGDVVLIHDEDSILQEMDLSDPCDLVGIDILTENGFYLGKVRDYYFRSDDGAVVSLQFDIFGVPLIPSTVISTYSLTADEVLEAHEDIILLRDGAENRVRKLSKGLFSRPKQPLIQRQPLSVERRKPIPQLTSSRSTYNKEDAVGFSGNAMDQSSARSRSVVEDYKDISRPSTLGRQQVMRENIYSNDRRRGMSEGSLVNRLGRGQAQGPFEGKLSTIQDQDEDDLQTFQPTRGEVLVKGMSEIPGTLDSQSPGAAVTIPAEESGKRGIPLSYQRSKRRTQDDL